MTEKKFTKGDIDACWEHHKSYLVDILNNEYSVEEAREDLRSLVGSKYDKRGEKMTEKKEVKKK